MQDEFYEANFLHGSFTLIQPQFSATNWSPWSDSW